MGKVFDDYGSKLQFVEELLPPVFAKDTDIAAFPVPVGRVYHSERSDVSAKAGSLLFESSVETLLKSRKV